MKIGIVCYPTFGGSGVVATELGLAMSRKGHEVHFITYSQPVRLDLLSPNVHFHEVHVPDYALFHYQPYELALSSRLVNVIKTYGIDVLHVHYAIPHAYAAYMTKKMLEDMGIKLPIVTTLHGTDITLVGSHPFYKAAVTFSINQSDVVTTVSESLKQDTEKLFKIYKDIKVIPNFIDLTTHVDPQKCERHILAEPNERIISHISNFRPVKRIADVIDIFKLIREAIPSKLIMVGDGPEKAAAEDQVSAYGLANDVVFLGKSREINQVLCYSDLFLLPSEAESFGLAALEAMAFGVPVVSSNTGGLPELNINGQTGYFSNVGDVIAMAEQAKRILSDDKTLNQFKTNAKNHSMRYDINDIMPLYEAAYEEAVQRVQ
jgi:L-malate glycosyltransferase